MRYRMRYRNSTGFVAGYFLVELVQMFVDIVRGIFELIAFIFRLIFRGIDHFEDSRAKHGDFEDKLREMVAPYMPVLTQKRSKMLVTDDYGELRNERWSKELGYFMGKVLYPKFGPYQEFVERNKEYVALLLDSIIEAEQQRIAPTIVPRNSRRKANISATI